MDMHAPATRATPRYSPADDRHILANWITLIAEDRNLDAADVARLSGIDAGTAQAILDGAVSAFPVAMLDKVLRAVERRNVANDRFTGAASCPADQHAS